jgi:hypothetical protein
MQQGYKKFSLVLMSLGLCGGEWTGEEKGIGGLGWKGDKEWFTESEQKGWRGIRMSGKKVEEK